ncbi:hypothetical protein [Methylobacterium cerastii]|uniref:hypothetical protein n=1 Tax=Methylobacterium cerastii TaxID=932741 RepID=UPI001EE2EB6D|nr:hypothetical protein [Methylobacterium cerastii]
MTEDTKFYRAHGGGAEEVDQYWTTVPPKDPLQAQMDSALKPDWGNTASQMHEQVIPAGTKIFEGAVAPQVINNGTGSLYGGGPQIFIPWSTLNKIVIPK